MSSASSTAVLRTAAFHVFGSGSAWAYLRRADGRRIRGQFVSESDNGFAGYVREKVTMYNRTRVTYCVGAHPGGEEKFTGTWGELAALINARATSRYNSLPRDGKRYYWASALGYWASAENDPSTDQYWVSHGTIWYDSPIVEDNTYVGKRTSPDVIVIK